MKKNGNIKRWADDFGWMGLVFCGNYLGSPSERRILGKTLEGRNSRDFFKQILQVSLKRSS